MRNKLKQLLVDNGFHHSWGYYISDTKKSNRIVIEKNKVRLTKNSNYFSSTDQINFTNESNPDVVLMNILNFFDSGNMELNLHNKIIDGVINANNSTDLKILLDELKEFKWKDATRRMFLIGLLQGALMQYKKDVSIDELNKIFKKNNK